MYSFTPISGLILTAFLFQTGPVRADHVPVDSDGRARGGAKPVSYTACQCQEVNHRVTLRLINASGEVRTDNRDLIRGPDGKYRVIRQDGWNVEAAETRGKITGTRGEHECRAWLNVLRTKVPPECPMTNPIGEYKDDILYTSHDWVMQFGTRPQKVAYIATKEAELTELEKDLAEKRREYRRANVSLYSLDEKARDLAAQRRVLAAQKKALGI